MKLSHPLPLKAGLLPVALFLALGLGAAIVVPSDYGTNPRPTPPDEGPHLGFIAYLAEHGRLPVFHSANDNYESHQPPLYYVSCLPAYLLARSAFPGPTGGLSRAGIVVVRVWTVLLSALTVWLGWLLGRGLFGGDSLLALGPPVFLAAWPGRLMIISATTNDSLAEALCLLVFLLCVVILDEGYSLRRVIWLGASLALAVLAKSTSLALAPVVLFALVMRLGSREAAARDPRAQRQLLLSLAIVGAAVALLAGWWFIRNQALYGDPLAAQAFERLFSKDRATPAYFLERGVSGTAYYLMVVVNTALSFWGVYGQANVYNPGWYYLLGFGVWAAGLVGWIWRLGGRAGRQAGQVRPVQKARDENVRGEKAHGKAAAPEPDWRGQAWVLAWVLLALVVAFFLRFNVAFYQAQARYLFAASGPIALLTTLGLARLTPPASRPWGLAAGLLVVLFLAVWSVAGFPWLVAAHYPPPFIGG
jgi:hypothetical protein